MAGAYIDFASNADDVNDDLERLNKTVLATEASEKKLADTTAKQTAAFEAQQKAMASINGEMAKFNAAVKAAPSQASSMGGGGIRGFFNGGASKISGLAGDTFDKLKDSKAFHAAKHLPGVGHALKELEHVAAFGRAIAPLAPLALALGIGFHGLNSVLERRKELEEAHTKGMEEFKEAMAKASEATKKYNDEVEKERGQRGVDAAMSKGDEVRQALFLMNGRVGKGIDPIKQMNDYADKTGLPGARKAYLEAYKLDKPGDALRIAELVSKTGMASMDSVMGHLSNQRMRAATDKFGNVNTNKIGLEEINRLMGGGRKIGMGDLKGIFGRSELVDNIEQVNKSKNQKETQDIGLILGAGDFAKKMLEESTKQITYLDAQAERDKAANELRSKVYNENVKAVAELQKIAKHQGALNSWFRDTWLSMGIMDPSAKAKIVRANEKMVKEEQGIDDAEVNP